MNAQIASDNNLGKLPPNNRGLYASHYRNRQQHEPIFDRSNVR